MDVDETIKRLKAWVKLGAWLTLGLLVAYVALKLAFGLFTMLVPVLFLGGAAYLGYRWWQSRLAPPSEGDDFDWELERERRRRW